MSKVYPATSLVGGVTGSLDSIDGTNLADKDVAIVTVQDGNMYPYVLDADSAETEASPYIISPDSNAGDKRWKLVGVQPAFSHVSVYLGTDQTLTDNTNELIEYDTENYDALGEFNTTTHIFTSIYAGYYSVKLALWTDEVAWTAGKYVQGKIQHQGVTVAAPRIYTSISSTRRVTSFTAKTLYLTAGQTISGIALVNRGSDTDLTGANSNNFMTIDRIA